MIAANEVMVGNIIEKDGEPREVIAISQDEIATDDNMGYFPADAFEPVLLTPEIIDRLEGVVKAFHNRWELRADGNTFEIQMELDGFAVLQEWTYKSITIKSGIKDLHFLQNLLFLLTTIEIRLKDDTKKN